MKDIYSQVGKSCELTTPLSSDKVFRQLSGFIFWQDLSFIINGCNDTAAILFGFKSIETMIGKTPLDFQCKAVKSAPEFMKLDTKAIQTKQTIHFIIIDAFANNKIAGYLVKKSAILDNGNVIGVLTQGFPLNSREYLLEVGLHLAKLDSRNRKAHDYCYTLENQVSDFDLSEKETLCLFYFIRGKTMRDIATILSLSPRTIECHINIIKDKMHCQTKTALIEKAIENGYMSFIPKRLMLNKLILIL